MVRSLNHLNILRPPGAFPDNPIISFPLPEISCNCDMKESQVLSTAMAIIDFLCDHMKFAENFSTKELRGPLVFRVFFFNSRENFLQIYIKFHNRDH